MADANVKKTENPESTHYDVLGVEKDATTEQINTAYEKLKLDPANTTDANAAENLKKLNEAHAILADEEARRRYDASLPEPEPKPTDDKDEPAPESNAPAKKSMFYAEPKQDDDPMVALGKELLNMLLEKYEEQGLLQATKDQYKKGLDYLNKFMDWLNKPGLDQTQTQTQTQANTITPTPDAPLTDNQKIDAINNKIDNNNVRIEELGKKFGEDQKKLESDYTAQTTPMSQEQYETQHKALGDKYQSDYASIVTESAGLRSQADAIRQARDVRMNPQPTETTQRATAVLQDKTAPSMTGLANSTADDNDNANLDLNVGVKKEPEPDPPVQTFSPKPGSSSDSTS